MQLTDRNKKEGTRRQKRTTTDKIFFKRNVKKEDNRQNMAEERIYDTEFDTESDLDDRRRNNF